MLLASLVLVTMLTSGGIAGSQALAAPLATATTCGDGGNFGAQLLGSAWSGVFTGVPVYSNGSNSGFFGTCENSATTPSGKIVTTGIKWQCVELVNRLYVTRGWISSTWTGNGGRSSRTARDSMFDYAPSNLQKQAQGSITTVSPGDVVSVNVMYGNTFEPDGHVLIVSAVSGSTVTYVSQNAASNTTSTVKTTGQLKANGDLTVKASGNWTYPVIGVVHAPKSSAGGAWTVVPSPNGAGGLGWLSGVSCVGAGECWAVGCSNVTDCGNGGDLTLIEEWNGTRWNVVPSPNAASGQGDLRGVACVTASDCWAVGSEPDGATTLVERWNGATWNVVTSPNNAGGNLTQDLSAVSCVDASDCWAVGGNTVEKWNGTSWKLVPTPKTYGNLTGVTCVSASDCWAVGDYGPSTLVEKWNGTTWTIVSSPDGADGTGNFTGVTCVSATDCWAVGYESNAGIPLIERWNGANWSVVPSPNPGGYSYFSGVTCVGAGDCWAVGGTGSSLFEQWNGTNWAVVPLAGAVQGTFFGVTCVSATDCWAVGVGGFTQTLVAQET